MISAASLAIPFDATNPGQFFACCGLFELADRLWPEAEICAYFERERFYLTHLAADRTISQVFREFANAGCEQLDPEDNAASPLKLLTPFSLRLDWWIKSENNQAGSWGNGQLKTWAGKQSGPLIFDLMRKAAVGAAAVDSPLDYRTAVFDVKAGKSKKKTISPFYFDSRREGTSLDLGFSPDEQGMSVECFPAVESLALVGIQRFRPFVDDTTNPLSFVYTCWSEPLPPIAAAVVVCGVVRSPSCGSYRFTKPSRGGEYVTMFSRAKYERIKK